MLLTLRLLRTPLCLRLRLLPCSTFGARPLDRQQCCNLMQSALCRSDVVLAQGSTTDRHDIDGAYVPLHATLLSRAERRSGILFLIPYH